MFHWFQLFEDTTLGAKSYVFQDLMTHELRENTLCFRRNMSALFLARTDARLPSFSLSEKVHDIKVYNSYD